MFLITNRNLVESAEGPDRLGERTNEKGPNELRVVEATKQGDRWEIRIIPDVLDGELMEEVGIDPTDWDDEVPGSAYVARKILEQANPAHARWLREGGQPVQRRRRRGRNLLFFVHGYNNEVEAVLERAERFRQQYNVEVITFTWPANGGGLRGALDYRSDKRDARASTGALDRALTKMHEYLMEFNEAYVAAVTEMAEAEYPDDTEKRNNYIKTRTDMGCPFSISMVLHSMGNYVYKKMLQSSASEGNRLLFDNIILAAADVNNHDHAPWVEDILCRNRVYITINEDDAALLASRVKGGEEQWARLGHYAYNLYAETAAYIQFTDVRCVDDAHAYFEGEPLENDAAKRFFNDAFNGRRAEKRLRYNTATNTYEFPRR